MTQWRDKVVVLNASVLAFGAELVNLLLDEGIKHVTIFDANVDAGENLQREFTSKYREGKVAFLKWDPSGEEELTACFKKVVSDHGHLDVVINYLCLVNDSKKVYRRMIATNFTSLVTSTLESLELMSKENGCRGGAIINVGSICALFQSPLLPVYSASKAAVLRFSNCIGGQEYFSRTGVRVISVCLGAYDSPLMHPANIATFDKVMEASLPYEVAKLPTQSIESVVQGLVDVYKLGTSGSTWLLTSDRPVKEITASIEQAYGITSQHVFDTSL